MPKPVLNLAKGQLPILGRPGLSLIPPSFCSQMHICTGTPHAMGLQQCCLPLILEETSSRDIEFLQAGPWSSKLIDSVFEWGYTVESLFGLWCRWWLSVLWEAQILSKSLSNLASLVYRCTWIRFSCSVGNQVWWSSVLLLSYLVSGMLLNRLSRKSSRGGVEVIGYYEA